MTHLTHWDIIQLMYSHKKNSTLMLNFDISVMCMTKCRVESSVIIIPLTEKKQTQFQRKESKVSVLEHQQCHDMIMPKIAL